jgi:hypothetical protein
MNSSSTAWWDDPQSAIKPILAAAGLDWDDAPAAGTTPPASVN